MRHIAIAILLLIAGAGVTSGCAHTSAKAPSAAGKPSLLINLTHGKSDLHAASMGLQLAGHALDDGSRVVVFLNVEAAGLADRDLGPDVRFADFPPIADQLKSILAKGGKVLVCGHCAAVMNVSKEQIAPGIVFAGHADVLGSLQIGMVGLSY